MKRRVSLIFNPVAGQGDPDVDLEEISSLLDSEIDLDVVITTAESKPGDLAKAAILQGRGFANERGAEAIIAAGGDGTLSAVEAALMNTNIPLGIISRGTANAFANALDLPISIPEACAAILAGDTKVVDMATCNGLPMVLLAGIGFEAETVNLADRDAKNRLGMLAYVFAGIQQLHNLQQFEVEIEVEDKIITVSAAAITIANAAPATSILAQGGAQVVFDDGMLDLTIVAPATPLIAILVPRGSANDIAFDLLSSTMLGEASGRDDVGFLRSKRFKVTTNPPQQVVVDGEVIGTTPVEIECIPNGLTVYAPQRQGVQPLEKLEGLPNLKILQRSN